MLRVDETEGPRWQLALELLGRGEAINFRGIIIHPTSPERLDLQVYSSWAAPTEHGAVEEVERGRGIFTRLLAEDSDARALLGHRQVRMELLNDYGNGAVLLATFDENGTLQWAPR